MTILEKAIHSLSETLKMNDKIAYLNKKVDKISEDIQTIDRRLIRIETLIELVEKHKLINRTFLTNLPT